MASSRLHNTLLFVIAVCLVLIVVHLYSGQLVAKAQAATSDSQEMDLHGCANGGAYGCASWSPARVQEGYQVTKTH